MRINPECLACMVNKQLPEAMSLSEPAAQNCYLQDVMRLLCAAEPEKVWVTIMDDLNRLRIRYGLPLPDYESDKSSYDRLMLDCEDDLRARIAAGGDRLLSAAKLARAGNYIDFSALKDVSRETLERILEESWGLTLDEKLFSELRQTLASAETLTYIVDNCGEIVLDKLFIEEIKRENPRLRVTILTRGMPVVNDATAEDARAVGMDKLGRVLGNGTAAPGTYLEAVPPEVREAVTGADLCIAKGQGNFESLSGCGCNIYYLFLCKCDKFAAYFNTEKLTGIFAHDREFR